MDDYCTCDDPTPCRDEDQAGYTFWYCTTCEGEIENYGEDVATMMAENGAER